MKTERFICFCETPGFQSAPTDIGGVKMSTFMAKNETMVRKWYVLDAAGKTAGPCGSHRRQIA